MGYENDEEYKVYDELHVRALEASLDGDYSTAIGLINELSNKYPDEGAPLVRKADLIYKGAEKLSSADKIFDCISMLEKAESLIKTQKSKYPMDKYSGLRDLYFLRGYFYSVLAGAMPEYLNKAIADFDRCLELDPSYEKAINLKERSEQEQSVKQTAKKSEGGCFIATAACGSEMSPEVLILRSFRDNKLRNGMLGKLSIRFYYFVSPTLASCIAKSETVRLLIRKFLISPLARKLGSKIDVM